MTTMDAPVVLRLPTVRDIRRAVMTDRAVAITAIITLGAVLLGLFTMLGIIAATGGNTAMVAGAIGVALTALSGFVVNVIKARRSNGGGGQ